MSTAITSVVCTWCIVVMGVMSAVCLQTSSFEAVLKEIDTSTGIAKCLDVVCRLDYLHDDQVSEIASLLRAWLWWCQHYNNLVSCVVETT